MQLLWAICSLAPSASFRQFWLGSAHTSLEDHLSQHSCTTNSNARDIKGMDPSSRFERACWSSAEERDSGFYQSLAWSYLQLHSSDLYRGSCPKRFALFNSFSTSSIQLQPCATAAEVRSCTISRLGNIDRDIVAQPCGWWSLRWCTVVVYLSRL